MNVEIPGVGIVEFPDGTPNDVIEAALAQYRSEPLSPETNIVEQSMSGVNEGIGGMLGLPVDAVTGAINGIGGLLGREEPLINNPVGGSQWLNEGILKPTISETQPQNMGQRYGRRIGREVGAMAIPGGVAMRGAAAPLSLAATELASAVGSGIGGQTSQELLPGNATADLIASMIGGTAPIAAARAMRPAPKAPTMDELRAKQGAAYDAVDQSQARLDPTQRQQLLDQVKARAEAEGMDELLHPKASRTVALLDKLEPNPLIAEVERKRRFVGQNVAGSLDPAESAIGSSMKDEIDNYLSGAANSGNLGPGAQDTLSTLQDARGLTQKIKKSESIMEALTKAERRAASSGTGGNEVNTIRQNIRAILDSPKKSRGYSPSEIKQMEDIVRGTKGVNALRMAGRLSPSAGALPSMGSTAAMIGGGMAGGPMGAAVGAIPGLVGAGAKKLAERTTQKQVSALLDAIRNGAPLAGKGVNQNEIRSAIAAMLARASASGEQ